MKSSPKIYLCHAAAVAIDPIVASFRANWPQAQLANLLEESWMPDLAADGKLTDTMIERFVMIGHYCVKAGADAILFTCSAFSKSSSLTFAPSELSALWMARLKTSSLYKTPPISKVAAFIFIYSLASNQRGALPHRDEMRFFLPFAPE